MFILIFQYTNRRIMLGVRSILFLLNVFYQTSIVRSYSKVSRAGQLERFPDSVIARRLSPNINESHIYGEQRSIKDITITMSPIYVPPRIPKLKNGEAFDYSPISKYSTLNEETIVYPKKEIQDRFRPPVSFQHSNNPPPKGTEFSFPQTIMKPPESSYEIESDPNEFTSFDSSHLSEHYPYTDEVIYDHGPEYHDDSHEPEMNDQRLDKRPYSYYFIGKKLWYIPLYFSIYFIIYVAALVLKSVARHKINFPAQLAQIAAADHHRKLTTISLWDLTSNILEGVESFANRFGEKC